MIELTPKEISIKISVQENLVRDRFISEFNQYFKTITKLPNNSSLDLSGITISNQKCFIELKERKYDIHSISACTFFENIKLRAFENIYKAYPESKLVYFNYYLNEDDNLEGYISFNLSTRLDTSCSELIDYNVCKCPNNNYNDNQQLKKIHLLKADPEIDVIKTYYQ